MIAWMMETLVWTAVLIGFVLIVRRPVSRHFGPQMAYALWALPALRLVLPPIELPAWMKISSVDAGVNGAAGLAANTNAIAVPMGPASEAPPAPLPIVGDAPSPVLDAPGFDWSMLIEPALGLWLIGAGVFLVLRFSAYFRLRDELLQGAREMGRSGKVRLIETPGTNAPLAFGVLDKVVALPEGFMAHPDRQSRDLALAHELAHHRGGDLIANVLIQPLFAIHWWNPLGRYGWLALRRDQEAACDARVMTHAEDEEREAYANLIVSFAAGPNIALAAPMACPVLGEKSIIHRLRSLKMDNINTKRRIAGRLMLSGAVVALPLTASISYAASDLETNAKNDSTQPSAASASDMMAKEEIIVIDPDGTEAGTGSDVEKVFVYETDDDDARKKVHLVVRNEFEGDDHAGEGKKHRSMNIRKEIEANADGQLSEEQIEQIMKEVREGLEQANTALEDLPEQIEAAMAQAEIEIEKGKSHVVRIERRCDGTDSEVYQTFEDESGGQVIHFCQKNVMAQALNGLMVARDSIKNAPQMDERSRSQALSEINRVIERWQDKSS